MIPSLYALLLLAVAAWRVFHLLAYDDILNPIRNRVVGLPANAKDFKGGSESLADFIECPFCLGFWVGLGWWGAWALWPHWTLVAAVPFVISAGVVAAQKYLTD